MNECAVGKGLVDIDGIITRHHNPAVRADSEIPHDIILTSVNYKRKRKCSVEVEHLNMTFGISITIRSITYHDPPVGGDIHAPHRTNFRTRLKHGHKRPVWLKHLDAAAINRHDPPVGGDGNLREANKPHTLTIPSNLERIRSVWVEGMDAANPVTAVRHNHPVRSNID